MRPILFSIMFAICAGCAASGPGVELGGRYFSVEIVDTREKQALGLMFRDSMPEDHGMLFIFPSEAPRSFWMKNTRIPLDILYFDKRLILVNAAENAQPCRTPQCPPYPSILPAMYVLELNAGAASELGVGPGDRLTIKLD